jgi:hypothetical protein
MELISHYNVNNYGKFKKDCSICDFNQLEYVFDHIVMHFGIGNINRILFIKRKSLEYLIVVVARLLEEPFLITYDKICDKYDKKNSGIEEEIIAILKGNITLQYLINIYDIGRNSIIIEFATQCEKLYGLLNLFGKEECILYKEFFDNIVYTSCIYTKEQLFCYIIISKYQRYDISLYSYPLFLAFSSPNKKEIMSAFNSLAPFDFNNEKAKSAIIEQYLYEETEIPPEIIKIIKEFIFQ